MRAYEFSATVTLDSKLLIPEPYVQDIPSGGFVRVIVLVDEPIVPTTSEDLRTELVLSLDEVIEEIKRFPQDPTDE